MNSNELKSALASGEKLTLIDVRTPAEFAEVHIPGTALMPLDRLDPAKLKAAPSIIICRSGKRSEQARQKLTAAGCENVAVLDGGVDAWIAAGHPVNRGEPTLSLERQVRIAAGLLVLTGVILGTWLHPAYYAVSAFVGAGLTFAGITDWCGMAMLLARMPWNQRAGLKCQGNSCTLS